MAFTTRPDGRRYYTPDRDAVEMCSDECQEVLGPASCAATGKVCPLSIAHIYPPLRQFRTTPSFDAAVERLTGRKPCS